MPGPHLTLGALKVVIELILRTAPGIGWDFLIGAMVVAICVSMVFEMKKPRTPSILFRFNEDVKLCGFKLSPEGRITLIGKTGDLVPAHAEVELSYDRAKGRKVLNRGPIDPSQLRFDASGGVTQDQIVVGIDTNTRTIDATRISVACVGYVKWERDDPNVPSKILPFCACEMHEVEGDPERVGLRKLCGDIVQQLPENQSVQITIVVDLSLGALEDINARRKPIEGQFLLPAGFTLVYATSDAATDSVANNLIADCDQKAREILALIEKGAWTRPLVEAAADEPFRCSRMWKWSPPDQRSG